MCCQGIDIAKLAADSICNALDEAGIKFHLVQDVGHDAYGSILTIVLTQCPIYLNVTGIDVVAWHTAIADTQMDVSISDPNYIDKVMCAIKKLKEDVVPYDDDDQSGDPRWS